MSFAVDANTLLYAADRSGPMYTRAREVLRGIFTGPAIVYVFWPVLMAYLRISTNSRIFAEPLTSEAAIADIEALLSLPHVRTGGEGSEFWAEYRRAAEGLAVRGNLVTDAHIVGLMHQHGVTIIWTRDRDFRKFDGIRVVDPFAEA